MKLLDQINSPKDLRKLAKQALPELAYECRQFLINAINTSGGHLAASLGATEIAIALHYVLNTPTDNLVWDVGHQAYVHKLLTGRKNKLHTIKQPNGLTAFPCRVESKYDAFGTGHSSTSISAALGMQIAKPEQQAVAVIGDGALTAGMAYEALNHAGNLQANILVVLNDNQMSISKNVAAKTGSQIKQLFSSCNFKYFSQDDGHDVIQLVDNLTIILAQPGPKVLHLKTIKGKGLKSAELDPIGYHHVNANFMDTSTSTIEKAKTYSDIFSDWIVDKAKQDQNLIAITPAMKEGSALVEFAKQFPNRYFDVAIAEQHAVTLAAGLACKGKKPIVAIYSTFLQRAYDQLIHDVCLQNLDVTFAIDRAGLVGGDGKTHHGIFDLSFLSCLPNLIIMAPSDTAELQQMLNLAYEYNGPAAVRYPRGAAVINHAQTPIKLELGKANLITTGKDFAILSLGKCLAEAKLKADKLNATLVDLRFVKPFDEELVLKIAKTHTKIITIEDNVITGGMGEIIASCVARANISCKIENIRHQP